MPFLGLTNEQRQQLGLEVVSDRARLQLTRLLRARTGHEEQNAQIVRQNSAINIARTVVGLPTYLLNGDGWGQYETAEYGWHNSELEMVFRRPSTPELVETLADLIQKCWMNNGEVNDILSMHECGFAFNGSQDDVIVNVVSVEDIVTNEISTEVSNIRFLFLRMDNALEKHDAPAVLHASASIFETLAKNVIADPRVENKTLGKIFGRYRAESKLPDSVLDYIHDIYNRRNTEPLAGHGQTSPPTITQEEAIVLCEMTRALVRIERQLQVISITKSE